MEENRKSECCKKSVIREEETVKKLLQRLNRIEGQVRGIKNMVSSNAYCTDIVIQVTAINEALHSFSKEILSEHIRSCVVNDIKEGKEDTVEDLIATVRRLMR